MKSFLKSYILKYLKRIFSVGILINTQGCDEIVDNGSSGSSRFLELYMKSEMVDGYYLVDYNSSKSHSYTSVYYKTDDLNRVFWTSVDTFCVDWFNDKIFDEIINYSTYSSQNDDGTWGGKQLIYLKRTFKGKQLSVIGCIDEDTCDSIVFRV